MKIPLRDAAGFSSFRGLSAEEFSQVKPPDQPDHQAGTDSGNNDLSDNALGAQADQAEQQAAD